MDKNPADLTAKLNDVADEENLLSGSPSPQRTPTNQRIDRDGAIIDTMKGRFLLNS